MELIDGKGKINAKMVRELFERSFDKNEVDFFQSDADWLVSASKESILQEAFKKKIESSKSIELNLVYGDACLQFTGKDFNWFLEDDRLAELERKAFKAKKDVAKQIHVELSDEVLEASIAYDEDGKAKTESFKGTKQECLLWLNHKIVMHCNLNGDVMLLIRLGGDNEEWHTLKELFDLGKIDVCK